MMETEGKRDGNSIARKHQEEKEGRKIRRITTAEEKLIVLKVRSSTVRF